MNNEKTKRKVFLEPTRVTILGTGKGYSVLELINTFSLCCGRRIPFEVVARRQGDVAECYADLLMQMLCFLGGQS